LESTNLLPVLALLALAVGVVILLLRFMRARHSADDRRAAEAARKAPAQAPSTKDEYDYLDSSHISGPILPGRQDALDTRADAWRDNKRK
jgi:hypothetical protein